ncbi:glycosyl hydrolase family 8 [Stenomitos frigidus]|uniref:Glycosyl hydrolase n=1 Tax=Stenomitos frigidus ULC18 TaxID=2107698 RepID=A0A2T1E2F5_9CYAN|nr:glycosyl hydrolase family 8 [Stenomitos frigidus]PSB26804.1 glycosyl hydrolase [Stenomitos frigidus ULC18]
MRLNFTMPLVIVTLILLSGLISGCRGGTQSQAENVPSPVNSTSPIASIQVTPNLITPSPIAQSPSPAPPVDMALLKQSWAAYRQRFIQADGRVIDWEADARSTSEGQAYAMLRSVMIDDPQTFALTLAWAEKNLKRGNQPSEALWAWKWGRNAKKQWGILDRNFASDADIDAITALILAGRRWNRSAYLTLAQTKLRALWALSVVPVGKQPYLLPGPREAFQQPNKLLLNPSYLSPAAFRLFAQVDRAHDWLSLVSSSYQLLERSAALSTIQLPSDWLALDTETAQFQPLLGAEPLVSRYGFDAYRVWWRLALDASWYGEPRARSYLQQRLVSLQELWRSQQTIPAQIDLQGKPVVAYEASSQYGVLYAAFRLIDPKTAEEIYQKKIAPQYRNGIWDNSSAYYTQNLVWFGLIPSTAISTQLLHPANVSPTHP